MIAHMKKVSIVTPTSDIEETLTRLRKTGVLHLVSKEARGTELQELSDRRAETERARLIIAQAVDESDEDAGAIPTVAPDEIVAQTNEFALRIREAREEADRFAREYERYEPWGEFSPSDISDLSAGGLKVQLYAVQKDRFTDLPDDIRAFVVNRDKTLVRFALVGQELDDFTPVPLPYGSLSEIKSRQEALQAEAKELEQKIADFGLSLGVVEDRLAELDKAIEFESAKLSMEDAGGLSHISGFAPESKIAKLATAAKKHAWALLVQEPGDEDAAPVLLENRKPVRIISPIFNLLGALPGYKEYDISLWFLIFFTIFFAMIIGDAGYGLTFLLLTVLTIVVRKVKGKAAGLELILLTVLSSATVVWGSLTGTWFGSEAIAGTAPFRYLVVESLSTFNPRSSEVVKYFCFVIGAAQIILAHIWNFISEARKKPRIRALGQLGWMSLVFGVFYLVLNLVLDPLAYPIPPFALYMIFGGLGFVVIFGEQEGHFFRGLLKGFAGLFQTFLDSISAFADVISYIRLFAVGLATVEIAKSFNAMASGMGNSVVGIIGAVLVLGIGHGINIVMGALSVIVHGVRLNMLEFSGHLGMEWSGIAYKPFEELAEKSSS